MEFGGTYLFVETLIKEFLQSTQSTFSQVFSGLMGKQVWHVIIGCHLCVGMLPQVIVLRTCPNMTLAIEREVNP